MNNLLASLMNDPEIGGRLSDISNGTNNYGTNPYSGVPYSSSPGMREAADMADKLAAQLRGDTDNY